MRLLVLVLVALTISGQAAALQVTDDRGALVDLPGPARRIISLAPHVTELLYAAGAGGSVVAAVEYSNHPLAARRLPRVGDMRALDLERIVALKPDLVIAWGSGSPQRQLDVLAALGMKLYNNEPRTLEQIADSIERFGEIAGTTEAARAAAGAYRARLAALRARYRGRDTVSVFHQVWDRPLMTVNGEHLISQVLALCGGRNVFEELRPLAPHVVAEAVLERDPEMIGATGIEGPIEAGLGLWFDWPRLSAIARRNVYVVDPDLISRHTPRILDGAEQICEALEAARGRRPAR